MATRVGCWRTLPMPITASPTSISHICQRRSFHATASVLKASGPLPTFKPTSSEELDNLLEKMRSELFIPAHMLQTHKRLVYRQKNHHILEEEPVSIGISGQTISLTPKLRQVPIKQRDFSLALDLMKTPEDADAIAQMTMGFHQAKRTLGPEYIEKMARKISYLGRPDLIMEFARNGEKLGIRFSIDAAREFMRSLRLVRETGDDKKLSLKAARNAVELYKHFRNNAIKVDANLGIRKDPPVIGAALYIIAETLSRWKHEDKKGDAWKFVRWLKMYWDELDPLMKLKDENKHHVWKAKRQVLDYTSVYDGMILAYRLMQNGPHGKPLMEDHGMSVWLHKEAKVLRMHMERWLLFIKRNKGVVGVPNEKCLRTMKHYEALADKLREQRIAEEMENGDEVGGN